jgi:ApbE superfamily uncharacterized protein (UPF0280 family)
LVDQLPALRQPWHSRSEVPATKTHTPTGRMFLASYRCYRASKCRPFITPMSAVAGAVAEEILSQLRTSAELSAACVNNGGDIALYLTPGEHYDIGVVDTRGNELAQHQLNTTIRIYAEDGIGGIATSGRHGRSHSLGIADHVTVLAPSAALADAAATAIASAVDLPGSPDVTRVPAIELAPDSDLGNQPVTVAVSTLTPTQRRRALAGGLELANDYLRAGIVRAATLILQGEQHTVEEHHDARV